MSTTAVQLNDDLQITTWGGAGANCLGREVEALISSAFSDLVPQHDQTDLQRALEGHKARPEPMQLETRLWHADGRALPFALEIDGHGGAGLQLTLVEISQRRLSAALAGEADYRKRLGQNIAGWTHELATPMGVANMALSMAPDAIASLQNAGQGHSEGTDPNFERLERAAQLSSSNLGHAITRLTAYQAVATDLLHAAPRVVDIGALLQQLLLFEHPRIKHSPLSVTLNCPENIAAQTRPDLLYQILHELFENTLQHGCSGDDSVPAVIDVCKEPGGIRLSYSDGGPGVPSDQTERILQPFFSTQADTGAAGLGLFRATAAATEMGIDLETFRPPSGGLGVCLRIPDSLR